MSDNILIRVRSYMGAVVDLSDDMLQQIKGDIETLKENADKLVEIDDLLDAKVDTTIYKTAIDKLNAAVEDRALKTDVYNKTEINSKLENVPQSFTALGGTNIASVGTPSVSYSNGTFTFNYLKGATGAKGEAGLSVPCLEVEGTETDHNRNRGVVIIDGIVIAETYGRGHTLIIFDPTLQLVESKTTYDTYVDVSLLEEPLANVANNKIVILITYDASALSQTARNYLRGMGSGMTSTWEASRVAHAFIGMKGLAPGCAYEATGSGPNGNVKISAYLTANGFVTNGAKGDKGDTPTSMSWDNITKKPDVLINGGIIDIKGNQYNSNNAYGINLHNSDIIGANKIIFSDYADSSDEGIAFVRSDAGYDTLFAQNGVFKADLNGTIKNLAYTSDYSNRLKFVGKVGSAGAQISSFGIGVDGKAYLFLPYRLESFMIRTNGSSYNSRGLVGTFYNTRIRVVIDNENDYSYTQSYDKDAYVAYCAIYEVGAD